MRILLLRHGRTAWNDERRYQGRTDLSLSPEGAAELVPSGIVPRILYVSPLRRARETAERVFPGVPQTVVDGLAETDLGAFEGHTYAELEDDPAYRAWLDGGPCPGGEGREEASERACRTFEGLVEQSGEVPVWAAVAHGGTLMAVLERFALPEKGYYDWLPPCGGGVLLDWDAGLWAERRKIRFLDTVRYGGGGPA